VQLIVKPDTAKASAAVTDSTASHY